MKRFILKLEILFPTFSSPLVCKSGVVFVAVGLPNFLDNGLTVGKEKESFK